MAHTAARGARPGGWCSMRLSHVQGIRLRSSLSCRGSDFIFPGCCGLWAACSVPAALGGVQDCPESLDWGSSGRDCGAFRQTAAQSNLALLCNAVQPGTQRASGCPITLPHVQPSRLSADGAFQAGARNHCQAPSCSRLSSGGALIAYTSLGWCATAPAQPLCLSLPQCAVPFAGSLKFA